MTDADIDATGWITGLEMKYGGRWWRCGGAISSGGERQYFLLRDGEHARVPALVIEAARPRKRKGGEA